MTLGATLGWPTLAVLGFFLLTGVVVALGTTSTARYEFERNGARERQRSRSESFGAHPAGSRRERRSSAARDAQARGQSVDVAVRPAAPVTGGTGWWLVDEEAQVLAGPFADRIDADWAALSEGLAAVSVFGARRADGRVAPRPTPAEQAWLAELGDQLDRLPADWDDLLTDTDPLTTLVVEIAAVVVEAGLSLCDDAHVGPTGGVCLTPDSASRGVVVSWRSHDRLHAHRGGAADATVQQSMNAAVAEILANLGFVVEPLGPTGGSLVTALR